jgi:hypothetical protein
MKLDNIDRVETVVDEGKAKLIKLVDQAYIVSLYLKDNRELAVKETIENRDFLVEKGLLKIYKQRISKLKKQEAKCNKIVEDCKELLKSYTQ